MSAPVVVAVLARASLFVLLLIFTQSQGLWATDTSLGSRRALLELGLGIGSTRIEDYPGSDQSHLHTLVLPVARYRGKILKADEVDGYRAEIIQSPKYEFNLSFGGSFPADSSNNLARTGMPNLDWTAEIGPRINYFLIREGTAQRLRLGLPLRALLVTNFQYLDFVGYVIAPEIEFQKNFLCTTCFWSTTLTSSFVSQGVANFFYQVEPRFETAERSKYSARAGFLGTDISEVLMVDRNPYLFFLGLTHSLRNQSANIDSPIFRARYNTSAFAAFSWFFAYSVQREEIPALQPMN